MITDFKTKLLLKKPLTKKVFLFRFLLLEPPTIEFQAGQYLILKVKKNDSFIPRLYSIASSPFEKNSFELLVELVEGGLASTYLKSLQENDEVIFSGPAGFFTLKNDQKPIVFLTTGTGIAPCRSMIYQLQKSDFDKKVYLFWGTRFFDEVYLFDEWKNIADKNPNFSFKICLSREENLDKIDKENQKYFALGHVNDGFEKQIVAQNLTQLNNFDYYLCGSRQVVESLKTYLEQKGVNKENIYFERF
jgi:ferredoxin-NADP reductase